MKFSRLVLLALLCLKMPLGAAWDSSLSPWALSSGDFSDWCSPEPPRRREAWERLAVKDTPPPESTWFPTLLGTELLWLYQHSLSGNNGARCPHYPSCSRYSRIAVETYGLALGSLMTAERFSRCHENANDAGQYSLREIGGEILIWDPPLLDAWWKGEK